MTASPRANDLLTRAFWNLWDEDPPAGDIQVQISDQHSDVFIRDQSAVLVEQRLTPVVKYAAWLPVSNELIDDARAFQSMMAAAADRHLRPWRYPDRRAFPTFDLFPRVTRLRARFDGARARLMATWGTLRYGQGDPDEFDEQGVW